MNAARQNEQSIFHTFFKYVSSNVPRHDRIFLLYSGRRFFHCKGNRRRRPRGAQSDAPCIQPYERDRSDDRYGRSARYSLSSTRPDSDTHRTAFTHALLLAALCALFFSFAGAFCSEEISAILGADHDTIGYASDYIRILLLFSPLFLGNNLLLCFVRNDGAPRLSMAGMLIGSLANIVLDYIFIYPLGMEMAGAATATATAPVISMLIMSVHFIKKNNRFHITKIRLSLKRAADICFLGVSSLVLELSSGIVIIVFNFLILKLNGNTGVAAYGILANIALVLTSVFTGIAQGIQPIVSRHADAKGKHVQNSIRKYALITSLLLFACFLHNDQSFFCSYRRSIQQGG